MPLPHRRDLNAERHAPSRTVLIALLVAGGILMLLGFLSADALLVVLTDGPLALFIFVAATGLGIRLVGMLGLGGAELRWQLLLATGLGLGALSLLMLGLGAMGLMSRPMWIALLVIFVVSGLTNVHRLPRAPQTESMHIGRRWMPWLWLLVIGFAGLALLGGTMPPGILWPAEGNGYDVLEYHFGAPRDYLDAGRIGYLPHNIYSNFPFNVEMLYLLSMILRGDPIAAVYSAKLLNVGLAFLAVAAVWLAGREFGRGSATIAALLIASCPFVVYLCGVAYVENGLLFYSALSVAALLRARRGENVSHRPARWVFTSGLLAGLACGCKYTAVVALVVPLAMSIPFIVAQRAKTASTPGNTLRRRSGTWLLLFFAGCLMSFGPWLVKNVIATGNPVFPLAHGLIGAHDGIWNDDDAARWHEGHLPAPEDRDVSARVVRLWHQVIVSSHFGPLIALGAIGGMACGVIVCRRGRADDMPTGNGRNDRIVSDGVGPACVICGLMILVGTGTWLAFTHLVDRFAIVLIVPSAILVGLTWHLLRAQVARRIMLLLLLVTIGWNFSTTLRFFTFRQAPYLGANLFGKTQLITDGKFAGTEYIPALRKLSAEKILIVGDARRFYLPSNVDYCVVFNRNPFAEAADTLSAPRLIRWLQDQGYSHVYVDWTEMGRLRNSRYGFWQSLDSDLFRRLVNAGLRPMRNFTLPNGRGPYATLFEVPASVENTSH